MNHAESPRPKPEAPFRSKWVAADPDEAFDFLADASKLSEWWGTLPAEDGATQGLHLDVDPPARTVHLRWGGPGMWRHMMTRVAPERKGSRITITFVPVPGCDGVCLDREILRARGQLDRLARILAARSHLVDSEDYWT